MKKEGKQHKEGELVYVRRKKVLVEVSKGPVTTVKVLNSLSLDTP